MLGARRLAEAQLSAPNARQHESYQSQADDEAGGLTWVQLSRVQAPNERLPTAASRQTATPATRPPKAQAEVSATATARPGLQHEQQLAVESRSRAAAPRSRTSRARSCSRRHELLCGVLIVLLCVATTPLWNIAKRPEGLGGSPLLSSALMWPTISTCFYFVMLMWHRGQPAVLGRHFRTFVGVGVGCLGISRLGYGLTAPDGIQYELQPRLSDSSFVVASAVYYSMLFLWMVWIPGFYYWIPDCLRLRGCCGRGAKARGGREMGHESGVGATDVARPWSASWGMSCASVVTVVYGTVGQVLERVTGVRVIQYSPVTLVFWMIALGMDRKSSHKLRGDRAYTLIFSFFALATPVGLGNFMIQIVASARSSAFGQVIAVGSFQIVMAVCYFCWKATSVNAVGDADFSQVYDLVFLFIVELFSEMLFMDIVPLSAQFFAIVMMQRLKDVLIHSGMFRQLLDHLNGGGGARKRVAKLSQSANAELLHARWQHQELALFADVMGTACVTFALISEYVSIDLGFGIPLLSARTLQYGRLPMLASYGIILTTQVLSAAVARKVLHNRMEAAREAVLRMPTGGPTQGQSLVISNPLHAGGEAQMMEASMRAERTQRMLAQGGAGTKPRRSSILDATKSWSVEQSLEAFWQRHWRLFIAVLAYGLSLSMRYVYDIKAVDYGVLLALPNSTLPR